jgi:hypothetical protein
MAIVTDQLKDNYLVEDFVADGNLTALEHCGVVPSAQSTGKNKVKAPIGQGVMTIGILKKDQSTDVLTDGARVVVATSGLAKAKANAAFNSGIELAVAGTSGKLAAAGSGDYVVAMSREAANAADHLVMVKIEETPYQKN